MASEKVNGSGLTTLSLVAGIFGFLGSFIIIGLIPSLWAIFFGHSALKRIRKSEGRLAGVWRARFGLAFAYSGILISLAVSGLLMTYVLRSRVVDETDPAQQVLADSLRGKSAAQVEEQIMSLLDAGRQRDAEEIMFNLPPQLAGDLRLNFIQGVLSRSRWNQWKADYFFSRVREIEPETKEARAAKRVMAVDQGWYIDRNMEELAGLMDAYPEDIMLTWLFAMSCREYYKSHQDTRYSEAGRKAFEKLDKHWDVGPSLFHQTYGNILRELELYQQALIHYQKAVDLEPARWSYKGLIYCLRDLDDKERAVEVCQQALELLPGDDDIIHELGLALARQGKFTEAAAKFEEAMLQDNQYSINGLAGLYAKGKGVEKNLDRARELYEKNAELGNAFALYSLARMYRDAAGVKVDRKKAEELYLQAARSGYPKALEDLGFMYDRGKGWPKDKVKAAEYYKQAAEAGSEWSAWKLACLYYEDPLVERDYEKSLKYFLLADELKHVDGAMYGCIGSQYYKGLGVQTNVTKAIEWWEKGFALNSPYSVEMLGHVYTQGIGVERDIPRALRIYRKALKEGIKAAESWLYEMPADLVDEYRKVVAADPDSWNYRVLASALFRQERYDDCIETCRTALAAHPRDEALFNYWGLCLERLEKFEEAAVKYQEGAELGSHWSYHNLALFYRNGRVFEKDLDKAREFYGKSAGMGNARAMYALGQMHRDGLGVAPDRQKAEKYFLEAGKGGYADGYAALGGMYWHGEAGGDIDKKKALKYYEQAADRGIARAAFNAGLIYYDGSDVKQDYDKSFKYFMRASELNCSEGRLPGYIAAHYQSGWGVETNITKAVEWLKKGVLIGDVHSVKVMAHCYATGLWVDRDFLRAEELLSKPKDSNCRWLLAALYSRAGRFEDAVRTQKEAIAILEAARSVSWAADAELREKELKPYQESLLLFESGQASEKIY